MWLRVVCWIGVLCVILGGCLAEIRDIGASCTENTVCQAGMFCDLGAPEGYCTMACSAALPCPTRSFCVRIESIPDGPVAPILLQRCLARCWAEDDCREGYKCILPDDEKPKPPISQRRGCFPKISS
ncbi:hypothetical protein L6R29_04795 [Myxococcota bacterium]|nr:hypothetical protein [Myxococcota bacterium]